MTSLVIEQIEIPAGVRQWRAVATARERVAEVLAGRKVWCATAVRRHNEATDELRACLQGAAPGLSADCLEVHGRPQLSPLADAVDRMLTGGSPARVFTAGEQALVAEAASDADELLGDLVAPGDVVVAHDGVSALVARAVRDRGAHAVWRMRIPQGSTHSARQAQDLLRSFTGGVDAYVLRWFERSAAVKSSNALPRRCRQPTSWRSNRRDDPAAVRSSMTWRGVWRMRRSFAATARSMWEERSIRALLSRPDSRVVQRSSLRRLCQDDLGSRGGAGEAFRRASTGDEQVVELARAPVAPSPPS